MRLAATDPLGDCCLLLPHLRLLLRAQNLLGRRSTFSRVTPPPLARAGELLKARPVSARMSATNVPSSLVLPEKPSDNHRTPLPQLPPITTTRGTRGTWEAALCATTLTGRELFVNTRFSGLGKSLETAAFGVERLTAVERRRLCAKRSGCVICGRVISCS